MGLDDQTSEAKVRRRDRRLYQLFCILLAAGLVAFGLSDFMDGECYLDNARPGSLSYFLNSICVRFGPVFVLTIITCISVYLIMKGFRVKESDERFGKIINFHKPLNTAKALDGDSAVSALKRKMVVTQILGAPGMLMIGLALHGIFGKEGSLIHPLLASDKVCLVLLVLGLTIAVWEAVVLIRVSKRLKQLSLESRT